MKPTVPEVIDRFRAYHQANPVWGSLHIVLEDGNFRNSDVQFCVDDARQRDDMEGYHLARLLLDMSVTQRRKLRDTA